jgi:hypothetical protein
LLRRPQRYIRLYIYSHISYLCDIMNGQKTIQNGKTEEKITHCPLRALRGTLTPGEREFFKRIGIDPNNKKVLDGAIIIETIPGNKPIPDRYGEKDIGLEYILITSGMAQAYPPHKRPKTDDDGFAIR